MAIHQAALNSRSRLGIQDLKFYRIYAYWNPAGNYSQVPWTYTQTIEREWLDGKQRALNEYKVWAPNRGRYALGYHSVPELIDRAFMNTQHYMDEF